MSHPAATSARSEREYGVEPPACRALPLTRPACVLGPAGPEPSWPGARAVPLSMLQAICPCEYRMRRHAPARRRRTSRAVCLLSWPGNPLPACQILCQCHVAPSPYLRAHRHIRRALTQRVFGPRSRAFGEVRATVLREAWHCFLFEQRCSSCVGTGARHASARFQDPCAVGSRERNRLLRHSPYSPS